MDQPKTQLGGKVIIVEPDGKLRELQRVYTDAVQPGGETPDNDYLYRAAQEANRQADAAGHSDGVVLDPWEARPNP